MTLLKIAQIGHPILRQIAREVQTDELESSATQAFIDDLIATMRDARGAGLAANQVYSPIRICALEVGDNPRYPYKPRLPLQVLVNPRLTPVANDTFENYEGCLSVPNLRGRVQRFAHIRVQALDRQGQSLDFEAKGITAGTYQHEVDHLDGKLFVDALTDPSSLCTWEHFQQFEQERFVQEVRQIVGRWGS